MENNEVIETVEVQDTYYPVQNETVEVQDTYYPVRNETVEVQDTYYPEQNNDDGISPIAAAAIGAGVTAGVIAIATGIKKIWSNRKGKKIKFRSPLQMENEKEEEEEE